jgi:hypothetical protein
MGVASSGPESVVVVATDSEDDDVGRADSGSSSVSEVEAVVSVVVVSADASVDETPVVVESEVEGATSAALTSRAGEGPRSRANEVFSESPGSNQSR